MKNLKTVFTIILTSIFLASCGGGPIEHKARKYDPDPAKRVAKNLEEGRGFRLLDTNKGNSGVFDFASSNELWRASLDTIDFMPLTSVNYSGGIIVTDWYSNDQTSNESIKISIRFLSNEIRADALDIKVFNKKCIELSNCVISEKTGNIAPELKSKILKTAAIYKNDKKDKDKK